MYHVKPKAKCKPITKIHIIILTNLDLLYIIIVNYLITVTIIVNYFYPESKKLFREKSNSKSQKVMSLFLKK